MSSSPASRFWDPSGIDIENWTLSGGVAALNRCRFAQPPANFCDPSRIEKILHDVALRGKKKSLFGSKLQNLKKRNPW
jgi:hypothetical protein